MILKLTDAMICKLAILCLLTAVAVSCAEPTGGAPACDAAQTAMAAETAQTHGDKPAVGERSEAGETEPQADPAAALSPELRKLLDLVAEAGKKYRSITADVVYIEEETVFGERSVYRGKVYYVDPADKDVPGRFRIHFDKLTTGGRTSEEDRDYVFYADEKGQWFVTRNAKIKQIVKYQVARPGERSDPLELGRGPFPIPFGQDPRRVVKMFDLSTRPRKTGDPDETTYVKLSPHDDTARQLRVRQIEMWVDPNGLPVKISVDDLDGEVRKTASFRRIDVKSEIDAATFELPWPSIASDWERRIEPLPEPEHKAPQAENP